MTASEQQPIFNRWLQQYQGLIFKVVRAYTVEEVDRDDLFQEICLQLWRSIPGFKGNSAASTWIYRIALRTAITWQKKERKERSRNEQYARQQAILHITPEPDDRLDWLFKEINQLDQVDRSLALLLLDGLSYKEMAEVLGISESNVGVKIYRVKQRLMRRAKLLEANGL